jgi:phosphoadenosine phosphosulfate reductase
MTIAEVFSAIERHEKAALLISGGKDSLACLLLLEPLWDMLTVYWCNPGAAFPETIEMMDRISRIVPNFKEITGDQPRVIESYGWPSDVVPVRYTQAANVILGATPFKIQGRIECCFNSMMLPAHKAMIDDGITLVIRGKRHDDADKTGVMNGNTDAGYEVLFPIYDWTGEQVHAYLDERGVEKPAFYRHGDDSLDCKNCTAWWGHGLGRYLQAEHPEMLGEHEDRMRQINAAITNEMTNCEVLHGRI